MTTSRTIPGAALAATLALTTACGTTGAVLGPSIDELETRWVELDLFFET